MAARPPRHRAGLTRGGPAKRLDDFSFAPQRFSSRDKPLSRFVAFAQPILEVLAAEVVDPTSSSRKAWAQRILRLLDSTAWCMIGMLADLADDCALMIRKLDSSRLDPVEFWQTYVDFRARVQSDYIRGGMWLRSGTYADRMVGFLSGTRVLQFGQEYQVLRRPTVNETRFCQAHVANVAAGILKYLKSEFPDCCLQAHFCCFELAEPEPKAGRLAELLKVLGWSAARSAACVQQYKETFPRARQFRECEDTVLECWARAAHGGPVPAPELADIVGLSACFLVSETECERNFAAERRQFDHRPKLSPTMRFAGLKVMVDGVALQRLQMRGEPRGVFWALVQNRYAEAFGSRFLTHVRRRKDAGVKRKPGADAVSPSGAGGKSTMAAVQRRRGEAARAPVTFGAEGGTDIFGYAPVTSTVLENLRKQEQTAAFARVQACCKKSSRESRRHTGKCAPTRLSRYAS